MESGRIPTLLGSRFTGGKFSPTHNAQCYSAVIKHPINREEFMGHFLFNHPHWCRCNQVPLAYQSSAPWLTLNSCLTCHFHTLSHFPPYNWWVGRGVSYSLPIWYVFQYLCQGGGNMGAQGWYIWIQVTVVHHSIPLLLHCPL